MIKVRSNLLRARFLLVAAALGLASQATAHVALLQPLGGEAYTAGEVVTIQWQVVESHAQENWDLHYSLDGGNRWKILQEDLPRAVLSYQWTVPSVESQQARIRITMDNVSTDLDDTSGEFTIRPASLPVRARGQYPSSLALHANYPNPFNPVTTIRYDLPKETLVRLVVHDLLGREISQLGEGTLPAGVHLVVWDGHDATGRAVPSGIYIARLTTPTQSRLIRMVLLK
jgi:hypothetical protein